MTGAAPEDEAALVYALHFGDLFSRDFYQFPEDTVFVSTSDVCGTWMGAPLRRMNLERSSALADLAGNNVGDLYCKPRHLEDDFGLLGGVVVYEGDPRIALRSLGVASLRPVPGQGVQLALVGAAISLAAGAALIR